MSLMMVMLDLKIAWEEEEKLKSEEILLPVAMVTLAAEKKSKVTFDLMKIACPETVKDYDDTCSFGNTAKGLNIWKGIA